MATKRYEHDPHWHVCPKCRQRYEDACGAKEVNELCIHCRTGMGWALLRRNREPRDCCVAHSKILTDKKELARLSLAGDTSWWRCRACGRAQGYDPSIKVYRHEESA